MREIKRIDVLSFGKLMGALAAVGGLIGGAFVSLMALAGVGMNAASGGGGGGAGILFGAGAIICFPIMYAVIGFLMGMLEAFVYNLVAGAIGGVKIELSE